MAQRLSELRNGDSLLALRSEDVSSRVVALPSLLEEVIDKAHQGLLTAHEGVENVQRLSLR